MNLHCICGQRKAARWHLVCGACWSHIPRALQMEVVAACRERHSKAIRECLTILKR